MSVAGVEGENTAISIHIFVLVKLYNIEFAKSQSTLICKNVSSFHNPTDPLNFSVNGLQRWSVGEKHHEN